jgi:hypothetical protein
LSCSGERPSWAISLSRFPSVVGRLMMVSEK